MEVEFDISCKVTIDLDIDKNNIKNTTNEELIKKLKNYLDCCKMTCEHELNYDGDFDNINVAKIKIATETELDNTLEDIAFRKNHRKKFY